jgi:HK97 family phage portal protein
LAKSARNAEKPNILQRFQTALRVFASSGQWRPQTIDELDRWLDALAIGAANGTIHNITGETALNFSAYFSGVFQISQTIGSCHTDLFKITGPRKKEPYVNHATRNIVTKMANPYMDAYRFKETLQHHAITWGNGYAWKQRASVENNLKIVALWPMHPGRMKVEIDDDNIPYYLYRHPQTQVEQRYEWDEIFHLAGFGFDGFQGYSLIELQAKAIDLGLTQQEFNINFIANGIHASGALTHPERMGIEAQDNLRDSIKKHRAGLSNAGSFLILEEGMTYTPFSMPLKDAEFLGSRVFQIQEIARILNMPPHKLKDMSQATYSNIEHQQIEYGTDTIRPWAERWEIALDTQLLTPAMQKHAKFEFDLSGLQRGDMKTQYEAYRAARYGGWYNANEIRYRIGDNPIEDENVGERYWQPTNMVDAKSDMAAGKQPEQPAPMEPEPEEVSEEDD